MHYSLKELENMRIKKDLLLGYNKEQVDTILKKICLDYKLFITENEDLHKEIATLQLKISHYKSIEEALQHTLLLAQRTSEDIKMNAQEKADAILKDAETGAQKNIKDANRHVTKINAEYENLKSNLQAYKIKSQSMLNTLQDLINSSFEELGD